MPTFKEKVVAICAEVAAEFEGWKFTEGLFKNGSLKHTNLIVSPGFSFDQETTFFQPVIRVEHKKSVRLCKKLIGSSYNTAIIRLDDAADFGGVFQKTWMNALVVPDKAQFLRLVPDAR